VRPRHRRRPATPHWLFHPRQPDCENQAVFEGGLRRHRRRQADRDACGRPASDSDRTEGVIDDSAAHAHSGGIDILSQCPFIQFYSLLLSAEHAFYWNVVSHSLLIRFYNQLPIVSSIAAI
jgi:hypothetical protein